MGELVSKAVKELQNAMETENVDPRQGLQEDLFLLATTLMPTVNINLFVVNQRRELLFTWREEKHHGRGGISQAVVSVFKNCLKRGYRRQR